MRKRHPVFNDTFGEPWPELAWKLAARGIAGEGAELSRFRPKYINLQGGSFSSTAECQELPLFPYNQRRKLRVYKQQTFLIPMTYHSVNPTSP